MPQAGEFNQYYRFNGASAVIQITAFGVARAAADQSVVIVQEHFTAGLILLLSLPGLTRRRACPTSALNCRNRKHPISMQSTIHGRWLLDRPVNPPIKSGEGNDRIEAGQPNRNPL